MLAALVIYLFVPHLSNNHKAKLLHPILIAATVLSFVTGQVIMSFLPRYTPVVLAYVASISPEKIVDLVNDERTKSSLPKLNTDPFLTQAALAKGSYMFAKNFWAHTAPDGTEPWKFVTDSGYQYRFAGENLARDFATPEAAASAWMASPTHKDNILSTRYQDTGVAVVRGELNGVETTIIVQFFGTKMGNSVPVSETKTSKKLASAPQPQVFGEVKSETKENTSGFSLEKILSISPFLATKNIGFFILSVFFFIISLDMVIVHHKNIPRVSSKSFAHLLFLGMIMFAIFVSQAGIIL